MKIVFETSINHNTDDNGDLLEEHCRGCWNITIADHSPERPYAVCNECGELRAFTAVGIEDGQWLWDQKNYAPPRPKVGLTLVPPTEGQSKPTSQALSAEVPDLNLSSPTPEGDA